MPRNISRCLFSGYLVVHHINSLTYCGCFVSLCRYLCFKKFFLHWWFGVIGYKWKSRKWARFLPRSCACFLYTESFQILLSYLFYSICVVLKRTPNPLNCWAVFPPSIHWIFMSLSMLSLSILCAQRHTFKSVFQIDSANIQLSQSKLQKLFQFYDSSLWTAEKNLKHAVTITIVHSYKTDLYFKSFIKEVTIKPVLLHNFSIKLLI